MRRLVLLLLTCVWLAVTAAAAPRTNRRTLPVPTIDDVVDSFWSADWCAPDGHATISAPSLPEKFTRRGYAVLLVERFDTDPEFWKRAKDLMIDASELRSMPKEPDGMYHVRGVVDAQIVKITSTGRTPIGAPIGQLMDIYGPDCAVLTLTAPTNEQPASNPSQQAPAPPAPPKPPPVPKRPTNVCETSECSVFVQIMKSDGEPCAHCPVMFSWSGMGFGTGGDATRQTDVEGFVTFRSPERYLSTIGTIVNRTGLVLPLRFNVDTLGGTSITITTPYTGR